MKNRGITCFLFPFLLVYFHTSTANNHQLLEKLLRSTKSSIVIPQSTYYLTKPIQLPKNKTINFNQSKLIISNPRISEWQIKIPGNTIIKNLVVEPKTSPTLFDYTIEGVSDYKKYNFNYNETCKAIWLEGNQIELINISIHNTHTALGGNFSNGKITNVVANSGYQCVNFYKCRGVTIENSTFTGGSFACIGMPSCSDIVVKSTTIYNPKYTGVNPGGASYISLTPTNVRVEHNNIIAGDCINLENGAINAKIINNKIECAPLVNKSINNSAIGVQTHDINGNGIIQNIEIRNNEISAYLKDLLFGASINIGNIIGNNVSNISVESNTMSGGNEGIRVEGTEKFLANFIRLRNNKIHAIAFGVRLFHCKDAIVEKNQIITDKSSWNNNLWGIQIHNCLRTNFVSNSTKGFKIHYYQTTRSKDVKVINPRMQKGEVNGEYKEIEIEKSVPQINRITITDVEK